METADGPTLCVHAAQACCENEVDGCSCGIDECGEIQFRDHDLLEAFCRGGLGGMATYLGYRTGGLTGALIGGCAGALASYYCTPTPSYPANATGGHGGNWSGNYGYGNYDDEDDGRGSQSGTGYNGTWWGGDMGYGGYGSSWDDYDPDGTQF